MNAITDETGNMLCYFRPQVQATVDVYHSNKTQPEHHVKLRLFFDDNQRGDAFGPCRADPRFAGGLFVMVNG